ncbi:MAG: phage baseplate assembly protein V [Allosphingosinicella sp.]
MNAVGLFPAAAHWLTGTHIAKVTKVDDPDTLGRIQVQLLGPDPDGEAKIWARVALPYAGHNFGAFLIPDVGMEVLVVFPAGDPAQPIVIGALWNGSTSIPETIGGDRVDRWTLTGRNGTRIAIVEESDGQETVEISTPAGAIATLTDRDGGRIAIEVGTHSIVMESAGITIDTSGEFKVKAASIAMEAPSVDVKTPLATFTAAVDCKTLTSTAITSTTYSPGAGNIW